MNQLAEAVTQMLDQHNQTLTIINRLEDKAIVYKKPAAKQIEVKVSPHDTLCFYKFKNGKMVKWFDLAEAPF